MSDNIPNTLSARQAEHDPNFMLSLARGLEVLNAFTPQRQRLTIARALVRRPELLILDDSASALDFATDAALRKALSKLPWKPTVVLISQRVSSIRHADKIVVLDDGHMAGLGTHTQLQQTCPVYQEICRSQEKGEASAS